MFAFCVSIWPALAMAEADLEVDVELFLAVDVSRSMAPFELEIQRRGYASALKSDVVINAIRGGPIGRIALTYVEWAGVHSQKVVVPWTQIETAEDARAVAQQITAHFDEGMRRTSISQALRYAVEDIENNKFIGLRRVIDVSGDGPNNEGAHVDVVRDAVLARRITINGLPLMTRDGFSDRWGIEDLDEFYRRCVIGGPGAFVIPVYDWDQFATAVRKKLVLEISGLVPSLPARNRPAVLPAQFTAAAPYNCQIGEEIWERNRVIFGTP